MLKLILLFVVLNLILHSPTITFVHSQRIIYSISRIPSTTSTWNKNYSHQVSASLSASSSSFRILPRSKRSSSNSFVPQRMPKGPKHQKGVGLDHRPDEQYVSTSSTVNTSSGAVNGTNQDQTSKEPKFGTKNISLVLAALLDHYDHNQRPGYGGPPAIITTNLEIRSMGPISELDMEYSLDCYFRQKWQDERLRFTGNANFLSLNIKMLDKIWKPDTYFHTGKASHLHMITTPNKFLRIFKNGLVLYSMRLTIKSLCPMDLHSFPMDKQSCPLILGSYGFPNDQLVYSWDAKPVTFNQKDFTLSQFDIVKTIYRNGTFRFKRGNHSMLQVNFNLRRHVGYFLIQIYVPCSLIVVLSWVSFWINREATSDRVGLGVTAVLTLSTFGLDSRSDLPRVSYATALDWYTVMCFLFVVFTLLEFAGVHYFTKVGTGEVPIIEIDDDWTKSSSDEDNDLSASSDVDDMIIDRTPKHHHDTNSNQLRKRRIISENKTTIIPQTLQLSKPPPPPAPPSALPSQAKMCNYPQASIIPQSRSFIIHPRSQQQQQSIINQYYLNELSSFETNDTSSIQHMPHCPRYRHQQGQPRQQASRLWHIDNYQHQLVYPASSSNFSSTDLKLNSSWPTLAWNQYQNENDDQWMFGPQHYSINHLPSRIIHDDDDHLHHRAFTSTTSRKIEPIDRLHHQPLEPSAIPDNEDWPLDLIDSGRGMNNWWIYTRFLLPVANCCVQFWYCFTANEEYKKQMIKRRTKGQGMCAVNSVSMIDKVSRILFPLVFFILNLVYWTFYINERNADFIQWEQ